MRALLLVLSLALSIGCDRLIDEHKQIKVEQGKNISDTRIKELVSKCLTKDTTMFVPDGVRFGPETHTGYTYEIIEDTKSRHTVFIMSKSYEYSSELFWIFIINKNGRWFCKAEGSYSIKKTEYGDVPGLLLSYTERHEDVDNWNEADYYTTKVLNSYFISAM